MTGSTPPLFERLTPERTGIPFMNTLPERPELNILNYLYYYNGGGVAVGDVDNDGLQDLYFSSNLGPNRLYRNTGDYRFEDITDRAGVAGPPGWKTGVTMADVNGDGRVDIYVSAVNYLAMRGRNALYLNMGDGTFADRTTALGLDQEGYSTQAAFFDYDGDGDLDAYLLNHSTHSERGIYAAKGGVAHPTAADRLLRNDGTRFVDVSARAGIIDGAGSFGLGVVVSDFDLDGCPDVYVANDFQENDFLWVNNCNGTFRESIVTATRHTSRFSMGVDAADINNDGRPDIFVADMLPDREDVLKTSASSESFNLFDLRLRAGYHPQYARNTLQLNLGQGRFSEIGYLAGVFASDWSWAPLFADLDNDGRKDLFVTSGIYRRPNDLDYINYVGNEAVQASLAHGITQANLALLKRMPQIPVPNRVFRNNGDLTFENVATAWGVAHAGFSNGAAYVDLTNRGMLDLVTNNINAPATIYRNRSREINGHAYVTVQLRGTGANTSGIGARVTLIAGGVRQVTEQMPTRGFESSVDHRLHFGLGTATRIDTLTVIWPDRRFQVVTGVEVNRTITLLQDSASGRYAESRDTAAPLFEDVTTRLGLDVRHEENAFLDYNREPLMPHRLSIEGPALAVADVNADGRDDIYVGGAKWQKGRLLLQRGDGTFEVTVPPAFAADSLAEDVDAAFFDGDGDGDQDLYVVSGGNEFWGDAEALRDRLYLNDGLGRFRRADGALPPFFENGSCVTPGDFDGDGDTDVFVGGRVVSRQYGIIPRSHLLRNDGRGHFVDVTAELAPQLSHAGMVSAATWLDYDGDGHLDLIVVGEWMPVRAFRQENGHFVDRTSEAALSGTEGWWNSVTAADVTGDDLPDLVLGNLGLNSYIKAAPNEPARLYVSDFGGTGSLKQILTFYKHGVDYPLAGRDDLVRLMPPLRSRYPSYTAFGASRIDDIFSAAELARATVLEARVFASVIAVNQGRGTFRLEPLPVEAQVAPIYASLAQDLDGDGYTDLLLAGNFHGVTPVRGWYDASYGTLLRGTGNGRFVAVDMARTHLMLEGQVRDLKQLRLASGRRAIAVARNGATLRILQTLP
ncbi:MAG: VCBS repeat-containing protein [Gemmatimonadaceae bacterium]